LLTDRELSSARLVLNPEKMVIKETQRAYMYLSLYGYATDALVCNRILPPQADASYFDGWRAAQAKHRETIRESFGLLPIREAPWFDREVVGLEMLRRMGLALFGEQDPTARFYTGPEQRIIETGNGYTYQIPLPLTTGKVRLSRSSADELVVHIANRKRVLTLPHTLAAMQIQDAHHGDSTLYIDFCWDAQQAQPEKEVDEG